MMLTEIEKQINQIEDLRELQQITGFVKDRKRAIGNRLKYTLSVGDKVQVSSGGKTDEGKVTKINRTRAVIDMRGGSWTVPFSMITVIKDDSDDVWRAESADRNPDVSAI